MAAHVRKDSATGYALLTDLGSGTPTASKQLHGDGTWTTVASTSLPFYFYGSGADGDLTLGSNTTLASGDNVKSYANVTLAGFTLQHNTADVGMVLYINNTLSLGNGRIMSVIGSAPLGAISATGGDGNGGNAGAQAGTLYVFANHITGNGTIGGGQDALNGTNGIAGGTLENGGQGATDAGSENYVMGWNYLTLLNSSGKAATAAGYQFAQAIGAAGGTGNSTAAKITITCKDYLRWLHPPFHQFHGGAVANDPFRSTSSAGAGGGNAAHDGYDGANRSAASGGGGSGGGSIGSGGASGDGGIHFPGANPGCGRAGGGGGGGGGGGFTIVVCNTCVNSPVISGKGGNGGNGGQANTENGTLWPGGGGGGGGGGGLAIFCGPLGSTATVTALGGTKGLAGTNTGTDKLQRDGVDGTAGHSHLVLSVA